VLEATPGVAEFGLAEAARDVPGYEPVDPSDVLFVRGGAADLKLVLLNGAPVFAPFHIGGLINALDTDLLRSATLYIGGAPARYDGGLSYVMDLETRSGNRAAPATNVSLDMLAARGATEGGIGSRVTYMLGARGVHGFGTVPLVGDPFPYTYGDGLGRIDVVTGPQSSISLTGFWNNETVRLDSLRSVDLAAKWGNRAGSIRYRTMVAGADALFTMAVGNFRTQLPLGGLRPLVTEGRSERFRLAGAIDGDLGPLRLHMGGSFDHLNFERLAWPRAAEDSVLVRTGRSGDVTGLYLDAAITAGPRLRLRGGVRADVFSLSPTPRLAPRLAVTVAVTERSSLTLAAGRYRQYVQAEEEPLGFIGGAGGQNDFGTLSVASATHLVVALDQDLGEGMRLGLEGFYKDYEGLPEENGEAAQASGVDLWLRRTGGSVTGWFGYSLAWVWSTDGRPYVPTHLFAGRQLVSAGIAGPITSRGEFDVRIAYGAGLPFTAIPEPEAGTPVFSLNPAGVGAAALVPTPSTPREPDQPYLRLDAQIARTWDADLRGFDFEFKPYIKVLNALDRRDALFYHFDRGSGRNEPRAIAALPVLPIVGVEWKF
jgi:hypothetical protein